MLLARPTLLFVLLLAISVVGQNEAKNIWPPPSLNAIQLVVNQFLSMMVPGDQNNTSNEPIEAKASKHFALKDTSNDEIARASVQQIITRSGFNYQLHNVLSSDGYVTQLIRIINILADPSKLKQPPVMLFHGGFLDPTVFVWASAGQHHPEVWPRQDNHQQEPFTSSNRSLAFALSIRGYDVWLVPTRGSNLQNQGHIRYNLAKTIKRDKKIAKRAFVWGNAQNERYWRFSMDELILLEYPAQISKVLEVTGAKKVSLVAYSMGAMMSLSLLGSNPKIAKKVHNLILLGPILNNQGTSNFVQNFYQGLISTPEPVGLLQWTYYFLTNPIREALLEVGKLKRLRYSLVWAFETLLFGPSPAFQTLLELPVVGHLQMLTSFRQLKHWAQQVVSGRLQMFDFGPEVNAKLYGSSTPRRYVEANQTIEIRSSLVVGGTADILGHPASVRQTLELISPRPQSIEVPGYNHLDLVAGAQNGALINLHCIDFLDRNQLEPIEEDIYAAYALRQVPNELEKFVPHLKLGEGAAIDGLTATGRRRHTADQNWSAKNNDIEY